MAGAKAVRSLWMFTTAARTRSTTSTTAVRRVLDARLAGTQRRLRIRQPATGSNVPRPNWRAVVDPLRVLALVCALIGSPSGYSRTRASNSREKVVAGGPRVFSSRFREGWSIDCGRWAVRKKRSGSRAGRIGKKQAAGMHDWERGARGAGCEGGKQKAEGRGRKSEVRGRRSRGRDAVPAHE